MLLGNHLDAWVFGAIDPSSGTAVMKEVSRVVGNLVRSSKWKYHSVCKYINLSLKIYYFFLKKYLRLFKSMWFAEKWRPRRTIIFCGWGAEEYMLMGSTEWVEVWQHCNLKQFESVLYAKRCLFDKSATGKILYSAQLDTIHFFRDLELVLFA